MVVISVSWRTRILIGLLAVLVIGVAVALLRGGREPPKGAPAPARSAAGGWAYAVIAAMPVTAAITIATPTH